MSTNVLEVERVPSTISPHDFYHQYIIPNKLCVLSGGMSDWGILEIFSSIENFLEDLQDRVPDLEVPVEEHNGLRKCIPVSDFCSEWNERIDKEDKITTKNNGYEEKLDDSCTPSVLPNKQSSSDGPIYLKDWHAMQDCEHIESLYEVPEIFRVDFLNAYMISNGRKDYRFVYCGSRGSSTKYHSDVFGSFSWSANVFGSKEWIFTRPGDEKFFEIPDVNSNDKRQKNYVTDITYVPILSKINHYRFIQNEGEIVFVPSGYYHQVKNIDNTLSINHNWINAANLTIIAREILEARDELQNEFRELGYTEHSEEWTVDLQRVLQGYFGMNFATFTEMLKLGLTIEPIYPCTERRIQKVLDLF